MVGRKWCIATLAALVCTMLSGSVMANTLSLDCQQHLDQMWSNYTNPAYTIDSCDSNCLNECKDTLETAIYVTSMKECPPQADIMRCFQIYAPLWQSYAQSCTLFTVASPSASAEGESASSATPSPPPPSEASPSPASSPPPPPPPQIYSSSQSQGEGSGRRLASISSEAEAGYSGSGLCFPSFSNSQEFEAYLNGDYFTEYYKAPTDTAGIILSVFFWVGLASLGFYLRK